GIFLSRSLSGRSKNKTLQPPAPSVRSKAKSLSEIFAVRFQGFALTREVGFIALSNIFRDKMQLFELRRPQPSAGEGLLLSKHALRRLRPKTDERKE
ncbi:MAG: hypothetical protein J6K28_04470, partial [Alistipes sp.]|nr:hypothetical protein [Alistipes sp.]